MSDTYRIVRHYAPHLERESEVRQTGLTLDEAQDHCGREDTREAGVWFDGYEIEVDLAFLSENFRKFNSTNQ